MTFREQQAKDLDVFYNTDEFSHTAQYKGADIALNDHETFDIESIESKSYKCRTSDVPTVEDGELFVLNGMDKKVINFDHLDDGLETIIALGEV